jgi:dolichyl-phosphate beta-glucosyltransferase
MTTDSPTPPNVTAWIKEQNKHSSEIELSVVIPAFNEERRLPPTLIHIIDHCENANLAYELIVVDDGSSDTTSDVVKKFGRVRSTVRLIRLPRNQGKGHAVKLGVLSSQGRRVLFADADGATPILELNRLWAALDQGADVAIGSRAKSSEDTHVSTLLHRKVLGRIFNNVVNLIILPGVADTQCGFKLFTRQAANFLFTHQRSDRFSFDVELLYLAKRAELKVDEVAVNWTNIPGSKVNLLLDSLLMLRDILRFRVRHRSVTRETFLAGA